MILPRGFRRLCLAKRPAKTALTPNNVASAREHRGRIFILKGGVLCAYALLHTIRAVVTKELQLCKMPLGENIEAGPSGSDLGGLLADLFEGARRRNLSANSLGAYERT